MDDSETKCPDMAVELETINKAAEYVLKTNSPAFVQYGITDDEGKEHVAPVYLITEQAYKYFLSNCTADELWDLGFLGQSPEHCVKSTMPFKLK